MTHWHPDPIFISNKQWCTCNTHKALVVAPLQAQSHLCRPELLYPPVVHLGLQAAGPMRVGRTQGQAVGQCIGIATARAVRGAVHGNDGDGSA